MAVIGTTVYGRMAVSGPIGCQIETKSWVKGNSCHDGIKISKAVANKISKITKTTCFECPLPECKWEARE